MSEEKKLTDEEIVKALDICTTADDDMDCIDDCPMYEEDYCTTKLLKMAVDLIHRLQDENAKQKVEIERLEKDVHDMSWIIKIHKYCVGADHCQNSSMKEFELQKQVDELNKKIIARESVFNNLVIVEKDKSVKITAKEILILAEDYNCGEKDDIDNFMLALKERYGVEVK